MAKLYVFKIVVRGSGRFPFDMLRYDACRPFTSNDAAAMDADMTGDLRNVTLLAYSENRHWCPTDARWHSFTWSVVSCEEFR